MQSKIKHQKLRDREENCKFKVALKKFWSAINFKLNPRGAISKEKTDASSYV